MCLNMCLLIITAIFFYLSLCLASDEIKSLPGLKKNLPFKHYSGYLNGGKDIHLHYWFVESQNNPSTDPVVLWLNGGPGCSSLFGLFTENGPFRIGNDSQTVSLDQNSWNALANVLYLESPFGVGYSYTTKNGSFKHNDDTTARMNYLAVEDFFAKYPQFANNSFYITGESYGGVYVPTLAKEFYDNKSKINLKGIAVGDGYFDVPILKEALMDQANAHGVIDDEMHNQVRKECCKYDGHGGQVCDFSDYTSRSCQHMVDTVNKSLGLMPNPYNVLSDCSPNLINKQFTKLFYDNGADQMESDPPLCEGASDTSYLNSADVRKAIHIPEAAPTWINCNVDIDYEMQHETTLQQVFKQLISQYKIPKFIVYNGDLDMLCSVTGVQRFVDQLGYKVTDKYKPWRVGGRIAGFVKRYEGITFTTIRGAGHFVPTDQPEAGLAVLKELLGISKLN